MKFDIPFGTMVALGRIPNFSPVNKFGSDPDADSGANDVWDIGLVYNWIASATAIQLSSSHASDTHVVHVEGLDANWAPLTELVTLTGQTGVDTVGTFIRVHRLKNVSATAALGDVYASESGDGLTAGVPTSLADARAKITLDHEQTQMAIYSVAAEHSLIVNKLRFTVDNTDVDLRIMIRDFGGVFRAGPKVHINGGDIAKEFTFAPPLAIAAKSDIKISVTTTGTNKKISAGFDGYLVRL